MLQATTRPCHAICCITASTPASAEHDPATPPILPRPRLRPPPRLRPRPFPRRPPPPQPPPTMHSISPAGTSTLCCAPARSSISARPSERFSTAPISGTQPSCGGHESGGTPRPANLMGRKAVGQAPRVRDYDQPPSCLLVVSLQAGRTMCSPWAHASAVLLRPCQRTVYEPSLRPPRLRLPPPDAHPTPRRRVLTRCTCWGAPRTPRPPHPPPGSPQEPHTHPLPPVGVRPVLQQQAGHVR